MSSPQKTPSIPPENARVYQIPDGQTQLIIGIVPRESIIFDKKVASLLTDKRYGCAKCPGLVFDKKVTIAGRSLDKHVKSFHDGERLVDLEVAAASSYRLRRKEKKSKSRGEAEAEAGNAGEYREDNISLTRYEYEMELLKRGNPYRMNPYDTSVPVGIPDEVKIVNSVYPDPELYSL